MKSLIFSLIIGVASLSAKADVGWATRFQSPKVNLTKDNKIRVLIVDTGVSIAVPAIAHFIKNKDDAFNCKDLHGHGTHIAGLILYGPFHLNEDGNGVVYQKEMPCKEVELVSCKFYTNIKDGQENQDRTKECFKKAVDGDFSLVNYSAGGVQPNVEEFEVLKQLQAKGTQMIVAAGNSNENLKDSVHTYYPASYILPPYSLLNITPVGNWCEKEELCPPKYHRSNYGFIMPWEMGANVKSYDPWGRMLTLTGTSQAAAIFTHNLIINKCNQIHNKGE